MGLLPNQYKQIPYKPRPTEVLSEKTEDVRASRVLSMSFGDEGSAAVEAVAAAVVAYIMCLRLRPVRVVTEYNLEANRVRPSYLLMTATRVCDAWAKDPPPHRPRASPLCPMCPMCPMRSIKEIEAAR